MQRLLATLLLLILPFTALFAGTIDRFVNVYVWADEIPDFIIQQFEKETGIKVNFSSYENNEIMFTKLRANKNRGYDVILPSSYFIDRMSKQGMLEKLDRSKLPNWKNLNPALLHPAYDPTSDYAIPYLWGVTGIFVNDRYFKQNTLHSWNDLWQPRFNNQLMLLDDMREIFSVALLSLGYSLNDHDPAHIREAYLKLKALMKNVRVFSTETVVSILIDEDANAGVAWNGDVYKAGHENSNIKFIFPKEGFPIWVDNFAIPAKAEHKDLAYQFINFMMRADIAKQIALYTNFPIANLAGQQLLPAEIRNNPVIYPSKAVLKKAESQAYLDDKTLAIYEKYWEELKMGAG